MAKFQFIIKIKSISINLIPKYMLSYHIILPYYYYLPQSYQN